MLTRQLLTFTCTHGDSTECEMSLDLEDNLMRSIDLAHKNYEKYLESLPTLLVDGSHKKVSKQLSEALVGKTVSIVERFSDEWNEHFPHHYPRSALLIKITDNKTAEAEILQGNIHQNFGTILCEKFKVQDILSANIDLSARVGAAN